MAKSKLYIGDLEVKSLKLGDYDIKSFLGDDIKYPIATPIDDAVVTCASATYNGSRQTAQAITVTLSGVTLVENTDYTITQNAGGTNAGSYLVVVSGIGDYEGTASGTFSIEKVTPTVTAPTAKSLTYNGSAQALVNAASTNYGTLKYSLDNSTYSTNIPSGTNATSYTVYYRVDGDSNINSVAAKSVSVTIAKANPTYTAPTKKTGLVYNGNNQNLLNAGSTSHGTIQYSSDNSNWSTTIPTGKNASTGYTAYWKLVGDSNHNNVNSTSITGITIAQKAISIPTPTGVTRDYNGNSATATFGSATSASITKYRYSTNGSSWTETTTNPSQTNAGTLYTQAYYKANDSNYSGESWSSSATIAISKASQSAPTATGATTTYPTTATATASGGGGQGSIEWESAQSQSSVGSHTTRARWSGNGNYNASPYSSYVTVQMNKASQSAPTAYGATVDYGSTATATASGGGGQGSIEWSNGNTRTAVGSQTTSARWSGNGNYNASSWSNSVTLTVNDPYVGHDYVEIGGLKWATMNVGANSVTDAGLYFQWGDTQGYTASQVGSGTGQKYFAWADYKYGNGTSSPGARGMTKYNSTDGKTVLEVSDDAARANWGGSWRMPTTAEYAALGAAVNTAWTADYQGSGVAGMICTDKTDSSKVLFFPACGFCRNGSVLNVGSYGDYWSSSLDSSFVQNAYYLYFNVGPVYWQYKNLRYYGFPVRGVVG